MEGSKDLPVVDTKDLGTLSWREVRIFYGYIPKIWERFHGGKQGSSSVRYQRFGNPFMKGSKDLLVLDTKDFGTLSWREGRVF